MSYEDGLLLEDASNSNLIEELERAHFLGQLNEDQLQRLKEITGEAD